MASDYSENINIELIGSGDQAGAWGDTTNQNWERSEESISYSSTVSLTGLTNPDFNWTLSNTVDAYTAGTYSAPGSTARAAFVEFTGSVGAKTVNIRGNSSGDYPDRVFIVRNSNNGALTFNCKSSTANEFVLEPSKTAIIRTVSNDKVENVFDDLQVDKISSGTGSAAGIVQSTGDQDLQLKTGNSTTGMITIEDAADGDITIAPNGNGDVTLTTTGTGKISLTSASSVLLSEDGYINFDSTPSSSGYGIRDSSGVIQASNDSGVWRNVITGTRTAIESGQFHIIVFPVLSADTPNPTSSHNLSGVPSLVTCSIRCVAGGGDLGYDQYDEVYWGSSGLYSANIGLSIYANATNVGYILGSADSIKIPRLDGTVGNIDAITFGSWSVVIRAWK